MFQTTFGSIIPDSNSEKSRLFAPLSELHAHKIENKAFHNGKTNLICSYQELANMVLRFGLTGESHLNEVQIRACLDHLQMPAEVQTVYFKRSVDGKLYAQYVLHLAAIMCSHPSQQSQIDEMWVLVNPALN